MWPAHAQQAVYLSGKVKNAHPTTPIYITLGGVLELLSISEAGAFSLQATVQQLPAVFYFGTVSKKKRLEWQTAGIWFDQDTVEIEIDWLDKAIQKYDPVPFQPLSEKMEKFADQKQMEFILKHPDQLPAVYFVEREKKSLSVADLDSFLQKISPEHKTSIYAKRIEQYVAARKRSPAKIGHVLEDFSLPDKAGNQVSVIQQNGKPKLITFFSSGCLHSIARIAVVEAFARKNSDKVEIVTLWTDRNKAAWLTEHAAEKSKMYWPSLRDEYGFASTYFNNTGTPTFYVIDREGKLIDVFRDFNQKAVNRVLSMIE